MLELINNNRNIVIGVLAVVLIITIMWYSGFLSSDKSSKEISENLEDSKDDEPVETTNEIKSEVKVYNFNTSWCRYSVMFAPEWAKFESMVEGMDNIEAIDVKCDEDKNEKMCMDFEVPGYPSVLIVKDGKKIDYPGPRNAEKLLEYLSTI